MTTDQIITLVLALAPALVAYGVIKAEVQHIKNSMDQRRDDLKELFSRVSECERRLDVEEATRDMTRRVR